MTRYPPWPTAVLRATTEAEATAQLAALAAKLGPLPQAEWTEPWGPDDPDGWEVRVGFPSWEPRLSQAHADWVPGESPAETRAREAGHLVEEELAGPIAFSRRTADGAPAPPDLLRREGADEGLTATARAVERALSAEHPGARLREWHPVVERRAGRFGIELVIGDDLPESAFEGIARCVGAALAMLEPPLADKGSWDAAFGTLSLVAWFDLPPVEGLPPGGLEPGDPAVLWPLLGASLSAVELRVIPEADPWATAAAVARAATDADWELTPAPPAWVAGQHTPAWWALAPVGRLPGGRVLAVPVPDFAEDDWADLDVRVWWVSGVAFANGYDPVARRDWWPPSERRELPRKIWKSRAARIGARGVLGVRRGDRDGVRWRFGPEAWTSAGLTRALAAVAALGECEAWGWVGFSPDGVWVECIVPAGGEDPC